MAMAAWVMVAVAEVKEAGCKAVCGEVRKEEETTVETLGGVVQVARTVLEIMAAIVDEAEAKKVDAMAACRVAARLVAP